MKKTVEDYMEKLYAGWLGKIIGVRHGAPIEMWSYEKIKNVYGEINDYLVDYRDFAADDDINGPIFFVRSLDDYECNRNLTPEQIGLTLLNYVPYEHGFYWWGGYGVSTEHTSYINMQNGIMPPRSGSTKQNGSVVSEQIGGQIFADVWGLVAPGNPKLAAEFAGKAACVTHDDNGVYGAKFIAACISSAFVEDNVRDIISEGLSVIPFDCSYAKVINGVIAHHKGNLDDWRQCYKYIKENYWIDCYPGNCHIIPNAAIICLSLLYGEGDFSKTINICNMCGFDTDCNVANVGTILGVLKGLDGIEYKKWRKPINDFHVCSSVVGSLNIMDIPSSVFYLARLAYRISGDAIEEEWKDIVKDNVSKFNFELPGSTHGFRISTDTQDVIETHMTNTETESYTGKRSLKVVANSLEAGGELRVFHKTYYRPEDFHDSRYDPSFSPIFYPGQTLKGCVMVPDTIKSPVKVCLYIKDGNSGEIFEGDGITLSSGKWEELLFETPYLEGACIEEVGIRIFSGYDRDGTIIAYLDDFDFLGMPHYTIDFEKEKIEEWHILHKEVSQFTYFKGIWTLEDGVLSGSCCDIGEAYTGNISWKDYTFEATLIPQLGTHHGINFRVQGAIRSYALWVVPNKIVLSKNNNGYKALVEIEFSWELEKEYKLKVELKGNKIMVFHENKKIIDYTDNDNPYLSGQIGASVQRGSHCHYKNFKIGRI